MANNLNLLPEEDVSFLEKIREAAALLAAMSDDGKLEALNKARAILAEHSPMRGHPVDCVRWARIEDITANDYNPNNVAPPEMRLLELSIREDGYTMPTVVVRSPAGYELIDGFHRWRVAKERLRVPLRGRLPVSVLDRPYEQRMASTIRHNRARGVHAVMPMTDIVARLCAAGWTDQDVGTRLGMDRDEVLRLKQCSGLAEIFKDREYSQAWE